MSRIAYILAIAVWIGSLLFYMKRLSRTNLASRERFLLAGLRSLALGLLIFLLFQPVIAYRSEIVQPLHLFVIADGSRSMSLPNRKSGSPRVEAEKEFLFDPDKGIVKRAEGKGFSVHVFSKTGPVPELVARADALAATGESTDLGGALRWIAGYAGDLDVGGILLLSDGRDTTDSDPAKSLPRLPAPLYTVGFGPEEEISDVSVFDLSAPPSVPSGEEFETSATVRVQIPVADSGTIRVVRPGDTDREDRFSTIRAAFLLDGSPIHSATMEVGAASRSVVFRHTIKADGSGVHELGFRVDPLPNEIVSDNNSRERRIRFEKNRFNVLVLAGQPSWEFKFLRRAIEGEKRLMGTYLLPRHEGGTVLYRDSSESPEGESIPEQVERHEDKDFSAWPDLLEGQDLVIVDRLPLDLLGRTWTDRLETWLGEGNRTLVFLAWPDLRAGSAANLPVAGLLPFQPEESGTPLYGEFTLRVPDAPAGYFPYRPFRNFDFASMPPLLSLERLGKLKTGAEVLLEAVEPGVDSVPAFVVNRRGLGFVAAAGWHDTWHWAMLGKRPDELDRFWRSLILFFLTGEEASPITLHAAGESFEAGEPVRLWLYLSSNLVGGKLPERIPLDVSGGSGASRRVYLYPSASERERYQGSFSTLHPGEYTIRAEINGFPAERQVLVESESAETAYLNRNASLLAELAKAGGGEYFPTADPEEVLQTIPFEPRTETIERFRFIGNLPWVIVLLRALFTAEWLLRRKYALPYVAGGG